VAGDGVVYSIDEPIKRLEFDVGSAQLSEVIRNLPVPVKAQ
jgi:hypothetical protein